MQRRQPDRKFQPAGPVRTASAGVALRCMEIVVLARIHSRRHVQVQSARRRRVHYRPGDRSPSRPRSRRTRVAVFTSDYTGTTTTDEARAKATGLRAMSNYEVTSLWPRSQLLTGLPTSSRLLVEARIYHVSCCGREHRSPDVGLPGHVLLCATSRFGSPDELDRWSTPCTEPGLGVIVDWVTAHFPKDAWRWADSTGPSTSIPTRRGEQLDWGTYVFDFGRREVRNFLVPTRCTG